MRLLPVKDALMLDGTVTTPVAHGRQTIMDDSLCHRPMFQHHRLRCGDPGQATGRHRTFRSADRLADRDKMRMAGKTHIDPLHRVPELIEGGVEVQVNSHGYPA